MDQPSAAAAAAAHGLEAHARGARGGRTNGRAARDLDLCHRTRASEQRAAHPAAAAVDTLTQRRSRRIGSGWLAGWLACGGATC